MQCIVNEVPVHYVDEGSGPVILMLHGWRNGAESFDQLANFGRSGRSPKVQNLEDYAAFLKDFLDKLEIGHLQSVLGHSMGGQIAIHAVSTNTLKTKHLILLASAGVRAEHRLRKTAIRAAAKVARPLVSQGLKGRLYKSIGSDYSATLPAEQRAVLDQVLQTDVQAEAARVKVPTLLLYGSRDTDTPARYGERFADLITHSRLEIVDAGHHLHQEQPEQVAKLIKDFLA